MNTKSAPKENSELVVKAYRSWACHIKKSNPRPENIIYMDDLSNVDRSGMENSVDWLEIFKRYLSDASSSDSDAVLKIQQSLLYSEIMNDRPTRASIIATGGISKSISWDEINALDEEIRELQKQIEVFPSYTGSITAAATKIAQDGLNVLISKASYIKPFSILIHALNPSSPFGAQVITGAAGEIICELRTDKPITPKFVDTIIHEILGHVLHFTQLKQNQKLQSENPHLLVLTLHTHEPVFIEAVAQLITAKLLRSDWNLPGRSSVLLENIRFRRTMAIIAKLTEEVLDGSMSSYEAASIHCQYTLEHNQIERMNLIYSQSENDLFIAKNRTNFYHAFKIVEPLLRMEDEQFYSILQDLLTQYFTPESLKRFVEDCIG